jgi:pentatricopeptide repeat protein
MFHLLQRAGFKITKLLLSAVVKGCGRLGNIEEGKQVHCMVFKHGFDKDMILMTSLLDMYSKCTHIKDARRVIDEMPERDVVVNNSMIFGLCRSHLTLDAMTLFNNMSERDVGSWNSLISGLAQNSEGMTALCLFKKMRVEGAEVDVMTMSSVLSVCADLAALVNGKQVLGLVIEYGFELYLPVGNAIIDMYAKCGCMKDAC